MERKLKGIDVDTSLWKKAKKHCVDQEQTISIFIEELIEDYFKKKEILNALP